jgi:AraC family transcriptional regulator
MIKPIRFDQGKPMTIAGFAGQFNMETVQQIGDLWRRSHSFMGSLPQQVGATAYGVVYDAVAGEDYHFNYLCGVEVSTSEGLSDEMVVREIPVQEYAIFEHLGSVTTLQQTLGAIWGEWYPDSGCICTNDPDCIEVYGAEFDANTVSGRMEIWIPVKQ